MARPKVSGDTGRQDDFGGLLRRRRRAAGLTQEELAGEAGLSVRAIRDLERGATSRPYRHSITKLAAALGLVGPDLAEFTRVARQAPRPGTQPPAQPGPAPGNPAPAGHRESAPAPRQLPGAAVDFTGRAAELKTLTGLLDNGHHTPGMVVISAIGGTAGVGKTALAVHWAHQVASQFPDGQLYINLRGYDPGQPMPPADALAAFLRALGVPGPDIPTDTSERAARYRSLLAGRRILILLDNAASVEQVRPLLPGSVTCAVVVTSRDTLAGLVARDGARRLDLDLLSPADATVLLTTLIGDRAAADPATTAALAAACARLPLALRIAAELAGTQPGVPLATLVNELTSEHGRLDLLEAGGDPYTAVRAVFSWSYRYLEPATARAFRLLSLHPRPDFDVYAAAALAGTGLGHARRFLDDLARASLVHATAPGRYSQHDLLRGYASELAAGQDGTGQTRAALTRLFDHYLHTASAAMDTVVPTEMLRRPRLPAPDTLIPPVTEPAAARAWLDDRRDALAEAVAYAAGHGWPRHATQLAATLARYLDTSGHIAEAIGIHTWARHAAQQSGDRRGEAQALLNLADIDLRQGRYREATENYRRAGHVFGALGDRNAQAQTRHGLGTVSLQEGRYAAAAHDYEQAVALFGATGDQPGEARALGNLVLIDVHQGHYRQAAERNRRMLELSLRLGDVAVEAYARHNLGLIEQRQGRPAEAIGHYRHALALFQQTGNVTGEAFTVADLGDASLREGHHTLAARHHRRALALFQQTGNRAGEAAARNGLGEDERAAGRLDQARAQHSAALDLAREVGDKCEWARAHDGLGHVCGELGDPGQARQHWTRALALYAELEDPEADQVRARLAGQQSWQN